jgi:hypothetical protein
MWRRVLSVINILRLMGLLVIFTSSLVACVPDPGGLEFGQGSLQTPFIPPPPAQVTNSLEQLSTPTVLHQNDETPLPTVTPACLDQLKYLEDLTIPDGMLVAPGEILDKRWRVANDGTCNWDQRYRMRLISGIEMGATPEQALYPARGGTEFIVRILFTAPLEMGQYRSAWQAYTPYDEPFGDPFYIEVVVGEPPP